MKLPNPRLFKKKEGIKHKNREETSVAILLDFYEIISVH